jgi:hypothetical protein
MKFYWLIIGILGMWRLTHLLHNEEGPWGVLRRLRESMMKGTFRNAVSCFHCLGMWMALPAAIWIGEDWPERIALWLALAGGASLLERATQNTVAPAVNYFEDAPATPPNPSATVLKGNSNV